MAITHATTIYNVEAESPIAVEERGAVARIRYGNPEFVNQIPVYIDPLNGDDRNDALTADTAIRTELEAIKRWGNQVLNVHQVWHLLNDFPASNPFYADSSQRIGNTGSLSIVGEKPFTTLYTGSITAAVDSVPSTNTPNQITDAAIPVSWTALGAVNSAAGIAVRVRITSGASTGAICYVGADLGANTARISRPVVPASTIGGTPVPVAPSTLVGASFVVETGYVEIVDFDFIPSSSGVVNLPNGARLFLYQIGLPNSDSLIGLLDPYVIFCSACNIGGLEIDTGETSLDASGCRMTANTFDSGTLLLRNCLGLGLVFPREQALFIAGGDTLLDGGAGRLVVQGHANLEKFAVFGWTGATTDGVVVAPGGTVRVTNVLGLDSHFLYGAGAGAGNSRAGVNVFGDGKLIYQATKPTIVGSLAEARVQGTNVDWDQIPRVALYNYELRVGVKGAVDAAATRYWYPDLTQNAADVFRQVLNRNTCLQNLRVRAATAPGGAVVDTLNLLVNGVASGITVTLTGAQTDNVSAATLFANAVATDEVSFEYVAGAGSVAADISATVEAIGNTASTTAGIFLSG